MENTKGNNVKSINYTKERYTSLVKSMNNRKDRR